MLTRSGKANTVSEAEKGGDHEIRIRMFDAGSCISRMPVKDIRLEDSDNGYDERS